MSRIYFVIVSLFVCQFTKAQTKEWKELTHFHEIMSATFHPAEEKNLQPLKDSAQILVLRAKEWKQAVVPQGYNAAIIKPLLGQLELEAELLYKAVRSKESDSSLTKKITQLHNTFHKIAEKCREH